MQAVVSTHSEVDIRDLLAAGDPATFGRIYSRNKQRVYKVAYSILKCPEAAREVVQEVFSTIWVRRDKFREVASLEAFIYIMARNRALSHADRVRKDQRMLGAFANDQGAVLTPDSILEHNETVERFEDVLAKLTDRQRQVFVMSREDHKSHLEIAQALNISPHTVNNHIKASLQVLRASMANRHIG